MNGLLIFDKPKDLTSHDMVYQVRKKTNIKRVGHTGTLDPMATGVLVMCIGKATKVSDYILAADKEYIAKIKLGILTDTLDITGNVLKNDDVLFKKSKIKECLENFLGIQEQTPPKYSAIKIKGKKLYEYAREGQDISIPKRKIIIHSIHLLDFNNKDEITIKVLVSKGTYIRSLANDIGNYLGTYGTLTNLRRTRSGDFKIQDALTLEDFKNLNAKQINQKLLPIDEALKHLQKIDVNPNFYDNIINGQFYKLNRPYKNNDYRIYCNNFFIGLGEIRIINGDYYLKIKKRLMGEV
ncbi:tRNA pseudouridine55 synthase [Peptoniphilus olsenii]|uniref:tRNA pseudouridine synthase B n=1 Tax=Peptoniphilus olsenii TaxID=411570 RepID=A0ABV2J706_9FIRM